MEVTWYYLMCLRSESKPDLVSQKAWLASVTGMTSLLMTPSTLYLQWDEKSSEIIWRAYKQGPDPMLSKKKKKKENSFQKNHTPKKENSSQEWKFKQCWSPVAPPITLTLLIFLELLEKDPSPAKIKLFVQSAWKADLWNTFSFPALRDGQDKRWVWKSAMPSVLLLLQRFLQFKCWLSVFFRTSCQDLEA